jgi:threonine dehydrogenase-like Zn-dependent dehydrogenase
VPDNLTDEQVLFLTDIFPTGYTGIDWAGVKGGEVVAIFGAGPVGIMAAKSAWLRGASRVIIVDTQAYRLDLARKAANAEGVLWENQDQVVDEIRSMSRGYGADVVVEAVGFEPDRNLLDRAKAVINVEKGSDKVLLACMSAVRRGGFVSVLGVYSSPFDNFPIHQFFDKGITIKGGQAPAQKHIDRLLKHVSDGDVRLDDIISHRLPLSQAAHGYQIFRDKKDNCTKVVLKPGS